MAENALTKLPLAGQAGVGAAAALVIVGGFWYFQYQGMEADAEGKRSTLTKLQEENRVLQSAANNLPALQQKVKDLETRLEVLKTILPPAKETPDLLRQVQYLASSSNLKIVRFAPGATTNKEFYQEWPINIDVEGTYHNLGQFFYNVGRLRRLVNMGNVRISALSQQRMSATIAASCTATTYVYMEPAPAGPKPPGAR